MELEGIISRINKYGDSNAYIEVITDHKVFVFFIKNIFSFNQKNILLNSVFTYGIFVVNDTKNILSDFFIINNAYRFANSLNKMFFITFVQEMFHKILIDNNIKCKIFKYLKKTLDALEKINSKEQILSLLLMFFAISLRLVGIALNVDSCVIDGGKKNIIAISLEDGGVVCEKDFDKRKHKFYTSNKLKIIRIIFNADIDDLGKIFFPLFESYSIFIDLYNHLYRQLGITMKSIDFVYKIAHSKY